MKLKYHKIPKIPLEVCTAEQKVAYNLAFADTYYYARAYTAAQSGIARSAIVADAVRTCMDHWTRSYSSSRYNADAICCALNAGMEQYFKGYRILSSYAEIGETFPAYYREGARI